MIIGVGLDQTLGLSLSDLRRLAAEAQRLGFQSVWTPAGRVPDAFHVCSIWAQNTSTVVGTAAIPAPRMWHPLSLAAQAATLARISEGRFILGLGSGGAGQEYWRALGMPNKPIKLMREYVSIVRQLLRAETVDADSPFGKLRSARLDGLTDDVVPIYLAALGDGMLRLAGEMADGVLLNWATTSRIERSKQIVAEAAGRAGRQPAHVPVAMYVRMCIDDDVTAARRALALQVVAYALDGDPGPGAGYRSLFATMGFERALLELSALKSHGARDEDLADAVPDEILRSVGYFGAEDGAREAFDRLATGLDHAIVRVITVTSDVNRARAAMQAVSPGRSS